MTRRALTLWMGIAVVVVLALVVLIVPVPYASLGPGPTVNTMGTYRGAKIITVSGRSTSTSAGHLNLVTVQAQPDLSMATAVRRWFDRRYAVVPQDAVFPPGQTPKQTVQQDKAQFTNSEAHARVSALRYLGYQVHVLVRSLASGSASAGKLRTGDRITAIGSTPATSTQRLTELVGAHKPGDRVTVHYSRSGKTGTAVITLGATGSGSSRRAVLGVTVGQEQPHPFTVKFDVRGIGGPSAGLMLTLGLIDELQPADLTGGKFIAGTGTIDDEGRVGPIGGIQQKLIAARDAGATTFLTPVADCAEASARVPDGLRLAAVSSLDSALAALKTVRAGGTPTPCPAN